MFHYLLSLRTPDQILSIVILLIFASCWWGHIKTHAEVQMYGPYGNDIMEERIIEYTTLTIFYVTCFLAGVSHVGFHPIGHIFAAIFLVHSSLLGYAQLKAWRWET